MLWLIISLFAGSAATAPITSSNISQLAPTATHLFADEGDFSTGWFVLSDDASQVAVVDRENRVWRVGQDGDFTPMYDTEESVPLVTGRFIGDTFYGLHNHGNEIRVHRTGNRAGLLITESDSPAAEFWTDGTLYYVERFDGSMLIIDTLFSTQREEPFAPLADTDAVVRIGRISAPYVITSTQEGEVSLWRWPSGERRARVTNGLGIPSVFGNINAPATHLAWRDNDSSTLYLLDLITGDNRAVATLNGDYVQWFFLSADASVIIGVNVGFEPNIVAWDTGTGQRTELGEYLACQRPQPDMARLSADATTLVIGCDAGLQFWQITP